MLSWVTIHKKTTLRTLRKFFRVGEFTQTAFWLCALVRNENMIVVIIVLQLDLLVLKIQGNRKRCVKKILLEMKV